MKINKKIQTSFHSNWKVKFLFEGPKCVVQSQATMHPGQWLVSNSSADTRGHQVGHEAEMFPGQQWSIPCLELHKQSATRRSKEGSCPTVWDLRHALECCAQTKALLYGTDTDVLVASMEVTNLIGSWSTHCPKRGCGSWVCSAWEGMTLGDLTGIYRYPIEKKIWRQTLLRGSQLQDDRQQLQVEIKLFWFKLSISSLWGWWSTQSSPKRLWELHTWRKSLATQPNRATLA